jgi:uncharacterized membrane protein YvbJ
MMKKYCKYCGAEMEDDFVVCCNCGKTNKNPKQVKPIPSTTQETKKEYTDFKRPDSNIKDDGSIGWFLLGTFVPFVGIILGIIWKKDKPKNSKMLLWGFSLSIIASIILKASPFSCWGI